MATTKIRSLISFDWAIKRLFRNKTNYEILEGFLSELLKRKIIIKNICESESQSQKEEDKYNKVDVLVEDDKKEMFFIELQYNSENDYFHRMLFGASKTVIDFISKGDEYSNIRKVYSINIVYFDLGTGKDYIYRGTTKFMGLHETDDELQLTKKQQEIYEKIFPGELHPEYYIIKVRNFNGEVKDTLDQWIYYLKTNEIKDSFTAQGLKKAKKILDYDNLSESEKINYDKHLEDKRIRENELETAIGAGLDKGEAKGHAKGRVEGEAIGLEKGRSEEKENIVINSHHAGVPLETISSITGLTIDQITQILKNTNY